jgi:type IV pilus assembly protein PilE
MQRNLSKRRMAGMTLLELMAVVVVIGVLGMIALPSYRQYVMRSQRTEAKAALMQLATQQERFYLQNRTYSGNPAALGFPSNVTERGVYALEITGADANGYTATARPRTGGSYNMTTDACQTFTITAAGARTATTSGGVDPLTCW